MEKGGEMVRAYLKDTGANHYPPHAHLTLS